MSEFVLNEQNQVVHTDELVAVLNRINRTVNKVQYKTDSELYKVEDYWTDDMIEKGAGDCDDYALTKRKLLIEAGVPWQCLSPTICEVEDGGKWYGHCVLIVRTSEDQLILDNNSPRLSSWQGYTAQGHTYRWITWLDPVKKKWIGF